MTMGNDEARRTKDEGVARDPTFRHSSFGFRHFFTRHSRSIVFALFAAIFLGLGGLVGSKFFGGPRCLWQESLLWVDGRSYVEATQSLQDLEKKVRAELARSLPAEKRPVETPRGPVSGMVAAPAAADVRQKLVVGQKLETGNQSCAVLLDDGTPVYLNHNTAVAYECCGELTLSRGEICVERRLGPPRESAGKSADDNKPPLGFVVNLPNGEVVVWTAKVDLRIADDGVHIVVVRGKAYVAETPLNAGQGFVYRGDKSVADTKPVVVDRPLAAIAWTAAAGQPDNIGWHVPEPQATSEVVAQPTPPQAQGLANPLARDWIFLVECSGDRTPQWARVQIEIVRTLVDFAEDGDTATLVVAGARPRILARYRLDATPETARRMVEMLERTHLVGGLNLQRAIDAAQPYIAAARNPVLVLIGGGHVTLGLRDPKDLLAQVPAAVRTLGIALTAGEWPEMIAAAAGRPGGRAVKIDPQEAIRGPLLQLLDAMDQASPALIERQAPKLVAPSRPSQVPGGAAQSLAGAIKSLLPQPRRLIVISDFRAWQDLILAAWQWQLGRLAGSDQRLQHLLEDPRAAQCSLLWRLAARLADERGEIGRAIVAWEKALELERAKPSAAPCAATVRRDYGWLLDEYRKLAQSTAGLPAAAPKDLVLRVMAAADRWRMLDPDPTPACYAAARVLADLDQTEEAWDYVTTPPDWRKLAKRLEKEGYGGMTSDEK